MSTTQTTPADVRLTLPARPEGVGVVRQALSGVADALDFEEAILADMKMAVTEACTNVVVHAYPDGEDGPLDVLAHIGEDRLEVVIRDQGRGIVPRPDSPGLGLGLPLIATLADQLELGTGPGHETEVRMTFQLAAAGDGQPA